MLRFVTMPYAVQYSNFEIPARVNTNYEISNVKKQMLTFSYQIHIKLGIKYFFILYDKLINYFY